MIRLFTKNATGVAPDGRLFAGDINALEDVVAALTDLTQAMSVGSISVGESGLQIVRYGTAEARLTGALRTDGILRGLGGIVPGGFTSTGRDALGASSHPQGMVIFNTTTGLLEYNSGTDSAPVWSPVGAVPTGTIVMWPTSSAPAGWSNLDGGTLSRTAQSALYSLIGTAAGSGDGSTTYNKPDMRGRVPAGLAYGAGHADVNTLFATEGAGLGARRIRHRHTVNENQHSHSYRDPGSNLGTGSSGGVSGPTTTQTTGATATGLTVGPQTGSEPLDSPAYIVVNFIIKL